MASRSRRHPHGNSTMHSTTHLGGATTATDTLRAQIWRSSADPLITKARAAYAVLGLAEPTPHIMTIKQAYFAIAKRAHGDVRPNGGDTWMTEVNTAYDFLVRKANQNDAVMALLDAKVAQSAASGWQIWRKPAAKEAAAAASPKPTSKPTSKPTRSAAAKPVPAAPEAKRMVKAKAAKSGYLFAKTNAAPPALYPASLYTDIESAQTWF